MNSCENPDPDPHKNLCGSETLPLSHLFKVQVLRHSAFTEANIQLVSGEVGEGGDHINITLKNVGHQEVSCRV